VELAEGGTLFFDEIGDISPSVQVKLLRLIQEREYERLGGTRTQHADIRILAATHCDLEDKVARGEFREDLLYRLNVVTLWLPPLRARREDIGPIARHYLDVSRKRNQKPNIEFDPAAWKLLLSDRWPGNVRQLVNVIERLVLLATGPTITASDVRAHMNEQLIFVTQANPDESAASLSVASPQHRTASSPQPSVVGPPSDPTRSPISSNLISSIVRPLREDLRRAELHSLSKALRHAKGNRALAARLLGISRRTLYTKLAEHGLE
jgi:two-component system response regulator AtoC